MSLVVLLLDSAFVCRCRSVPSYLALLIAIGRYRPDAMDPQTTASGRVLAYSYVCVDGDIAPDGILDRS